MNEGSDIAEREELHTRTIEMRGFRRADGLFEVEGRVIDTKPFDYRPRSGEYEVPKGQRIHDITLTLVLDERLEVKDVRTHMRSTPYDICPAAGLAMRALIGLRIGPGWNSEARKRLLPAERCTHLAELLGPMATTALQALSVIRRDQPEPVNSAGRPLKIDSCFAYSAGRDLVRRRWPQFHEDGQG
ncbi:DUF2889 domain-containing protein [Sphingobium sp. H39-3-25]|uniref:DUF2889 domain-containing protein n=1 Tax=Sphingobium arseniciresistens TaxID=3030834 RepID=UPI0023B8E8E9|nr:DUF2889 domain-containing protein [Sphingobium arseniciresistens]